MTITKRQDKIRATIQRVEARLAKLQAMTDKEKLKKYGEESNWYWWRFDIEQTQDQLKRNYEKLEEAIRLDAKEEQTQQKKSKREQKLSEAPAKLVGFARWVESVWIKQAIDRHNYLKQFPYPEYRDRSQLANEIREDRAFYNEEKVRKDAKHDSEALVLNLMARCEDKCGRITDTDQLRVEYGNSFERVCINGRVIGEKGQAVVESITAGGYNIQRFHIRVLVK